MNIVNNHNFSGSGLDLVELMEALFYRDEFLNIASHELKTPLTAMRLQAQVLKRSAARSPTQEYPQEAMERFIDLIDSQTHRMGKLIEDMLDISRIRAGKLVMVKESLNLTEIVNHTLLQKDLSILNVEDIWFHGDRHRLCQAFGTLLDNAKKYGRKRPIEVSLIKKKQRIVFSVKDQGIGLSDLDQKRIFQRFQRAVPASEVSGLGLGLYMAKEIVSSHEGLISVRSILNQGSTFSITLKGDA
jgi:signal transduction histidine kinase